MQFDSFVFPVFFALVLVTYWSLRAPRAQNLLLLAASYLFYGWWDVRFLSLVAVSTVVDFAIGRALARDDDARTRRRWVTLSVAVNLGILGVFKYYGFFVDSALTALASIGVEAHVRTLQIVLPVGISFYTFQTLSYTIDVYRRQLEPARDPLAFACYVAFFPQLVAGPIERATRLLPQFSTPRTLTVEAWRSGATLIVFGFAKKIAIADNAAPYADYVFGLPHDALSGPLVVAGAVAFAVQIYADFSAYSDIARGTARWLGFELCVNFDQPYRSRTPSEFWRRWHISLSSWLRDYLYIPLGGNRGSEWFTYRNLMITMVLGGLWHGAAGNFVLWGIYHGAILGLYRFARVDDHLPAWTPPAKAAAGLGFFALTLYGWMLFRATTGAQILAMTASLPHGWSDLETAATIVLVSAYYAAPILAHHVLARDLRGEKWQPASPVAWAGVLAAVTLWALVHARASQAAFIYFQF